jgi:quinol monooxygenase YgiN
VNVRSPKGERRVLVVAGTITFDPAHQEDVIEAACRVVEATRQEAGCLSYEFFADLIEPGRLIVFEEWEEESHLLDHLETPHLAEFRKALQACGMKSRDIRRYYVSSVGPNSPA